MKQAVITGVRQTGLADVAEPRPFENWVAVKIHAAPMCTEYKSFIAGHNASLMGHEAAGEVVAQRYCQSVASDPKFAADRSVGEPHLPDEPHSGGVRVAGVGGMRQSHSRPVGVGLRRLSNVEFRGAG